MLNGKLYYRHRIVYYMHTGLQPDMIDHIGGTEKGDAFENLQPITHSQNIRKSKTAKRNKSGIRGVHRCNTLNRWVVQITVNKKTHYVGSFSNKKEAIAKRKAAEKILFGQYQPDRRAENV